MYSLEQYLALEVLSEKEIKKIKKVEIVPDQEGKIWLYIEIEEIRREEKETKKYKRDISSLSNRLEETYYRYIATDLLRQGYKLVAIEGGWIVEGGEETYQLTEDTCTCRSRKNPCKHLIFKEWHLRYRAECNYIKSRYK